MDHKILPPLKLSPSERMALVEFLSSDQVDREQTYDYCGTHGFLTALNISPVKLSQKIWWPVLFPVTPNYQSEAQASQVQDWIQHLMQEIEYEVSHDIERAPYWELSTELSVEEQTQAWAVGFLEALLLQEDAWFDQDEEALGALLLPIFVWSEMFEEPIYQTLRQDPKQAKELMESLPQMVIELYLFFHANA